MSTTTAAPGTTGSARQVQCSGRYAQRCAHSSGGCGGEVPRLDAVDDRRVGERRRVAERLVLGDVAQQAAHDLARPRLRQLLGEEDRLRLRDRADELGDVVAQLLDELVARLVAAAQDHERGDRLTGRVVGAPDDRRLGHRGMVDERGLDLGRGDVVARRRA